ncbi:rhodanese-like domain-containing protein [Archangium lansingense]|uniref:rhodanese-like domain-containing protein n=1 Tax=Archangium lansingense TaxID=2995310 RepID=UPI003B76E176
MSALYEKGTPHVEGYRDMDVSTVAGVGNGVRLVDVREPSELEGLLGHIAGVERVPLGTVEEACGRWPRDAELVMVCRSGARSGRAAAQLVRKGFHRVMNLRGGMLAWNEAGLPVVRPASASPLLMTDVFDTLLARMRELGSAVPTTTPQVLLQAHGGAPTREQFLRMLELLQAAGQVAVKDPGAWEQVLRGCRDMLAVARPESSAT